MEPIQFPTYNVSMGQATAIVKFKLDDPNIPYQTKFLAIRRVTEMETHNGITKDELLKALRWIFQTFEFVEEC